MPPEVTRARSGGFIISDVCLGPLVPPSLQDRFKRTATAKGAALVIEGLPTVAASEALVASDAFQPHSPRHLLVISIRGVRLHAANAILQFAGVLPPHSVVTIEGVVRPTAAFPTTAAHGGGDGAVAAILFSNAFTLHGSSFLRLSRGGALNATVDCADGVLIGGHSVAVLSNSTFAIEGLSFGIAETARARGGGCPLSGGGPTLTIVDVVRFGRVLLSGGSRFDVSDNTVNIVASAQEERTALMGVQPAIADAATAAGFLWGGTSSSSNSIVPADLAGADPAAVRFIYVVEGSVLSLRRNALLLRSLYPANANQNGYTSSTLLRLGPQTSARAVSYDDTSSTSVNDRLFLSGEGSTLAMDANEIIDASHTMDASERTGAATEAAEADPLTFAALLPALRPAAEPTPRVGIAALRRP